MRGARSGEPPRPSRPRHGTLGAASPGGGLRGGPVRGHPLGSPLFAGSPAVGGAGAARVPSSVPPHVPPRVPLRVPRSVPPHVPSCVPPNVLVPVPLHAPPPRALPSVAVRVPPRVPPRWPLRAHSRAPVPSGQDPRDPGGAFPGVLGLRPPPPQALAWDSKAETAGVPGGGAGWHPACCTPCLHAPIIPPRHFSIAHTPLHTLIAHPSLAHPHYTPPSHTPCTPP